MSTLVATPVAASSYQLGLGPNYSTSVPCDLYLGTNTTSATISPVTSQLIINATGTMAAVTVNLPANAGDGDKLAIFANAAITSLTLTPASATQNANGIADTVSGGVTSLAANGSVEYTYRVIQATSTSGMPVPATNLYTWYRSR